MAGKLACSIRLLWHGWPINRPHDYQPLKNKNLCLSTLDLVHKSGNGITWIFALKIVYIHLPCNVDRGRASILSPGKMSSKEKNPCQTVNMEKNSVPGEGMSKNDLHANSRVARKLRSQRVTRLSSRLFAPSMSSLLLYYSSFRPGNIFVNCL